MKKIIVCGGRNYTDRITVYITLDKILSVSEFMVIHGGATGADELAADWARLRGMPCVEVRANWDFYKKSAGPRRNEWMLELGPSLVVAFPGNAGTRNMIAKAHEAGISIMRVP